LDPDSRFHGLQVVKIWPGLEYFSEHNLFFFPLYKLNFFLILSFSWRLRYFCLSFLGFFGWFFKFLYFFLNPFFQYLKWFFKTIYKVRVPFSISPLLFYSSFNFSSYSSYCYLFYMRYIFKLFLFYCFL
jgi:hypothetical protein